MQTVKIPMDELAKILQLQMDTAGSTRLTVTGSSMLPMLHHGKDSVILSPIYQSPTRGALPLYLRQSGEYVLHRILRSVPEGFLCCGDNQWQTELVRHDQLLAIVTGFTRNGKEYPITHWGYRLYVWLWVGLHPVRRYILAIRRRLGKLRKYCKK